MKLPTTLTLLLALLAHTALADVRINEIMASNGTTIADEDGDFEDWIELVNTGHQAVDLSGWGLSDNENNPFKWSFPSGVSIAPGEFLLVWASGKDRNDPAGSLHTNYSISAAGEPISLRRPDNTQADFVPAIAVPRDISYGRQPDGTGDWFFFDEPTPGASNITQAYNEVLDPPAFSHEAGFYTEAFELTISHPDPGVTIYYSLDGSDPNPNNMPGVAYDYKDIYPRRPGDPFGPMLSRTFRTIGQVSSPILLADRSHEPNNIAGVQTRNWHTAPSGSLVSKGTVVRANAFKPGAIAGRSNPHSYFVYPQGSDRYSLPVVSITTQEDNLFDYHKGIYVAGIDFDNYRIANPDRALNGAEPGNYRRRGIDHEIPSHFEYFIDGEAAISSQIGVRIHGGLSRRTQKKSLRIYARSAYGQSSFEHAIFPNHIGKGTGQPIELFRRLILRSGGNEMDFAGDLVVHRILQPAQIGTMADQPVVHFINGEYWGVMALRERIDDRYIQSHYDVDPLNLFAIDAPAGRSSLSSVEYGGSPALNAYREFYDHAVGSDLSDLVNQELVSQRLDLISYFDYLISFIYLNNTDWGGQKHFYFWRAAETSDLEYHDGKWRLAVWDFDATARRVQSRDFDNRDALADAMSPTGFSTTRNPQFTLLLRSLVQNDSFRHLFINRFADQMNTILVKERIDSIVDEVTETFQPERAEAVARWGVNANPLRNATLNGWKPFTSARPAHQRDHIRSNLGAGSDAVVTLNSSLDLGGKLGINTITIDSTTPGLPDPENPYPWTGTYFQDVPITLRAIPEPGYQFAGWLELPDEVSPEIEVTLTGDATFTAIFEEAPPEPEPVAIHAWDFEDVAGFLLPSHTLVPGASISEVIVEDSTAAVERHPSAAQGFDSAHLRVNEPLDVTLTFAMPTTGFDGITLALDTRRSGQGAGLQTLSYTVNGSDWIEHTTYEIFDATPQSQFFDFSAIESINDNPDFAIRITFSQSQEQLDADPIGGAAGNNRFDDVVLSGFALPGVNMPPLVDIDALPSGVPAFRAGLPTIYDLSAIFTDPDDDPLTFSAISSQPGIAAVSISGDELTLTGLAPGESLITIEADDGTNDPVAASFLVLIYPEAHDLAVSPFMFEEWNANSPAMTFPANMIFLQSEINDPELATPLTRAYQIPLADAAAPADADFPYAAASRSRINGLGEDGIAFINTGRGRDVGAALVAIDTTGLEAASVSFTTETLAVNNRIYAIRLQYRVGDDGPFLDLPDALDNPVEYIRSATTGTPTEFGPIALPSDALDEPYVQLQWKYHYLSGSGSRAQIRLDDIVIAAVGEITGFAAWQTGNFSEAELDDPAVSGPDADTNGSGIANLMRYALGLGRNDPPWPALPTLTGDATHFRFPFDPDKTDITYRVTASPDLIDWSDIVFDSSQPHTLVPENGHLEVPIDATGARRFFRLEVER